MYQILRVSNWSEFVRSFIQRIVEKCLKHYWFSYVLLDTVIFDFVQFC